MVTATATDGSGSATAEITVVSPIIMTPVAATTPLGSTQQFSASVPVNWTVKCGTITAGGLFTATAAIGTYCTVEGTAQVAPLYTVYGYDKVSAASSFAISPLSPTVSEGMTQQFTASSSATFAASCGTITPAGLFTAPLVTASCTVTATSSTGSLASTVAIVTSPLVITPYSAATPAGLTQQFSANAAVLWVASCGSINAAGLYTASAPQGSMCTIGATAASGTAYTASVVDTIAAAPALTISPASATLSEGSTQQFTSSGSASWSATCGSIGASTGLYTAPLTAGPCTVTATPISGTGSASAAVTVTSPLTITPASATTVSGQTQQFTANMPVTWASSCAGMNATSGLFTASAAQGTVCSIKATATGTIAYTAAASDTIGASGVLAVTPASVTVNEHAIQQFTASQPSTWKTSCGGITSAGLFTAPLYPSATCEVTATATSGGESATSKITVVSPIVMTPVSATTPLGSTQQFTASAPVSWTARCGTITSSGLFTATAAIGTPCTVEGVATVAPLYTVYGYDVVSAPSTFAISPLNPTVSEGATQQFTASSSATFTASCGSISTTGLFTAPLIQTSCTITAKSSTGSLASTIATVTSMQAITITPATANLHALNTQTFTASEAVTWTTSCGSISSAGVFTAPATASTCTVTATAKTGTASPGQATAINDVVNQVRWRNDPGGTGLQSDELVLTPANVNSANMAQAWSAAVDGGVWAEPLYMNAVTVNGASHNVLYVTTDNDSVYALDADTGAQLWMVSLIPSGATAVTGAMIGDTAIPYIGVLGTPVIDGGTLYVVAETAEQNATYFPHRLHALDITNGKELLSGPVLVSDPNLQPVHKLQRPGLAIANGAVYVAFGSLQDKTPYHGVLFAFNETTLAEITSWTTTPTGGEGGIWQGGGAPSLDSSGNVYLLTGNGTADGVSNFGESVVKLSPQLQLLDFFSPYNATALSVADLDLGSASAPVMPAQLGQFPHEMILCGKSPVVYVVNRVSMGGYNTTSDNIVQELTNIVGGTATGRDAGQACYSTPSAWGDNIYFAANGDVLKQFSLNPNTGLLSTAPVYKGAFAYDWPGSQAMISSNGSTNGIIWTFDNLAKKVHADNASNVSLPLWVSPYISTGYLKWTTPTVINGHVYVGGQHTVVAFAPINQAP